LRWPVIRDLLGFSIIEIKLVSVVVDVDKVNFVGRSLGHFGTKRGFESISVLERRSMEKIGENEIGVFIQVKKLGYDWRLVG
jgi:hypothetical protein